MRQQQSLCKLRQTTREDTFAYSSRLGVCEWEMTYGIADVGRRDNARVKEDGQQLDDSIEVEEHKNFLAT